MQLQAHLHVVGWLWRGGSWKAGSLDGIPPLVMQLEAQLHVVRWECEGGSWSTGSLKEICRWLCSRSRNCTSWAGSGEGGSWNTGSYIKPVMLPPVLWWKVCGGALGVDDAEWEK